jgi:hypothetical protein
MAVRDIFKISWKTFVNPAAWFGYESFRIQNLALWSILKDLFSKPTPRTAETFDQAMQRLQMTPEDCKHAARQYRIYAFCFLSLGIGTVVYAFYLFLSLYSVLGWLLGLAAAALFIAQGFKYDFWALQLNRHQLGLTFKDWKASRFGGKGTSS